MDTNRLKRFAQEARTYLLDFVKTHLPLVLAENSAARREKPQAVAELEKARKAKGDEALIDKIAYTWFNRFCKKRGCPRGQSLFEFARHGRALTGASPEHAQVVGSV